VVVFRALQWREIPYNAWSPSSLKDSATHRKRFQFDKQCREKIRYNARACGKQLAPCCIFPQVPAVYTGGIAVWCVASHRVTHWRKPCVIGVLCRRVLSVWRNRQIFHVLIVAWNIPGACAHVNRPYFGRVFSFFAKKSPWFLSCCDFLRGVYSDTTQLNWTQLNSTDPVEQRTVVFLFMTSRPTNWVNWVTIRSLIGDSCSRDL